LSTSTQMDGKMKGRYLVFASYVYYPLGGLSDVRGSFDTLDEAIKHINQEELYMYDDCDIYDRLLDTVWTKYNTGWKEEDR